MCTVTLRSSNDQDMPSVPQTQPLPHRFSTDSEGPPVSACTSPIHGYTLMPPQLSLYAMRGRKRRSRDPRSSFPPVRNIDMGIHGDTIITHARLAWGVECAKEGHTSFPVPCFLRPMPDRDASQDPLPPPRLLPASHYLFLRPPSSGRTFCSSAREYDSPPRSPACRLVGSWATE